MLQRVEPKFVGPLLSGGRKLFGNHTDDGFGTLVAQFDENYSGPLSPFLIAEASTTTVVELSASVTVPDDPIAGVSRSKGPSDEQSGLPIDDVIATPLQTAAISSSAETGLPSPQGGLPMPVQQGTAEPAPLPPEQIISFFTESLDTLFGRSTGTTFVGNGSTVQSFDRIVGGDGFNVADLQLGKLPSLSAPLSITATNIDKINVTLAGSFTAVLISAKWWNDVSEFWVLSPATSDVFVNLQDVHENMTFGYDDFRGDVAYRYEGDPENSLPSLNLILRNGSEVRATIGGEVFQQLDITSSGSGINQLILELSDQSSGNALHSLFVSGDARLVLAASSNEFKQLTYLDAKNISGGIDIDLDGSVPFKFFGGNGADFVSLKANSASWIEIDGGNGVDSLEIGVASLSNLASGVHNFEELLLRGTLDTARTVANVAGFQSIELLDRTTDYGRNLTLDGFSNIIIDDDQNASLRLLNGRGGGSSNDVSVEFKSGADIFGNLDASALHHIALETDDQGVVIINSLTLAPNLSFEENTISFRGEGNFRIGGVHGSVNLVDLSQLRGTWIGGSAFGAGTDYSVGNLNGTSVIWLDAMSHGKTANSQILFGSGSAGAQLAGTVQIHNFDLIDPSRPADRDMLDLGRLGVSSLADLSITVSHGDTLIGSPAHLFDGMIQLVGVNLVTAVGGAGAYIEFDGILN